MNDNNDKHVIPLRIPFSRKNVEWSGYTGRARLVALFWQDDNTCRLDDGQVSIEGKGWLLRDYVGYPQVWSFLCEHNIHLGSSAAEASHWFLVDQVQEVAMIAPVSLAKERLQAQWSHSPECSNSWLSWM